MMSEQTFERISPNYLRWIIALCLLTPYVSLAENGLQAAAGASGTALINNQHGVPVINIVAPNAGGLSHNQFLDYNVNTPGVVLNNAVQAGQSQLAGALAANPQFQGQAASTILNEVISRNASRIEGPQEIFGSRADYILANPNGITLNGGTFINTTRAGFLVGSPEVDGQSIKHFDTRNATGTLQVLRGGQSNLEGALDLIAPRVDNRGSLVARDDLNLTVGRNLVRSTDQQVIDHRAAPTSSVDASLFGAMQAGRIRILSTAEGAGVRMADTQLRARDGISIQSQGGLAISGTQNKRSVLNTEHGAVTLNAAENLSLSAVEVKGQQILAKAGSNLTLDTRMHQALSREHENREEKWWFVPTETYNREVTHTARKHLASQLQASENIDLQAGKDISLVAATVQAKGDLSVLAGSTLNIIAATDSQQVDEQIHHRKHLWRGDQDTRQYKENAKPSELSGQQISLVSAGPTQVLGSSLSSKGDTNIKAGTLEVAETTLNNSMHAKGYRGDLASGTFFGTNEQSDGNGQNASGSSIHAGGALTVAAQQVQIKGSKVNSLGDALVLSEKGLLTVDAAQSQTSLNQRASNSKLFGLIKEQREQQEQRKEVLTSDVASQSNLRLASADELRILGAKIDAGQQLQLQAKKDITVGTAEQSQSLSVRQQNKGFTASASQTQDAADGKPDSHQYNASVGYNVSTTESTRADKKQIASALTGAQVKINGQSDVNIKGSSISATAGDLQVDAQDINLVAAHDQQSQKTSTRDDGGGLSVSGGIDKLGSAFDGYHKQKDLEEHSSQAQRSSLQSNKDLRVATGTMVNEGAVVTAGQGLALNTGTLQNRAVDDTQTSSKTEQNWQASLGASVAYRGLTRPIENLIKGEEASRFQQASIEDALAPPAIGAELEFKHLNREEISQTTTAQVAQLNAGGIDIKSDTIEDTGTQYRAAQGPLSIQAQNHRFAAAQNSSANSVRRLDVETTVRADTSTGSDINLRLSGKGGSLQNDQLRQTANPGSLYGKTGIQIQLGSDGAYEGTHFDAGQGSLKLLADGNLGLEQANDKQQSQLKQLDGSAWAKGGNNPLDTSLELRGYLDHATLDTTDSQARIATIDAKGDVQLQAGGTLELAGARIGSNSAKVANISLHGNDALAAKAATDSHTAHGKLLGGGVELLGNSTAAGKGGGVGGHVSIGHTEERSTSSSAAQWSTTGKLTASSAGANADAVHLQGVKASAAEVDISASNGGVLIEATSNTEQRNNQEITAGAGVSGAPGATSEQSTRGLYARAEANIDRRDNLTYANSEWRAKHITLNSLTDTRLEGVRMEAEAIEGKIGGDLRVASRQDRINTLKVDADARLSQEKNPQGYINAATALAGPFAGKVEKQVGPLVQTADPKLSPTFKLDIEHTQRDSVTSQSLLSGRDGVTLMVGGETALSGARVQAAHDKVELGNGPISQETLNGRDYRRAVNVNASNAPVDLISGLIEHYSSANSGEGENAVDLGLVSTSGHDRRTVLASSLISKSSN
ncbi:hemagglutinin repeat-containing protein [Pseudomonas sp. DG56-2]|uniref:hemagglutinin repeat-containing protein n=1 Tax=Pseudomonas sp. DG56-2 TaxID=2320270 RepID=UPI0010A5B358|nr:hemagglutinin repeat-containing protein [Pseudomonas sp. DG56-2]